MSRVDISAPAGVAASTRLGQLERRSRTLWRRRLLVGTLNLLTIGGLAGLMGLVLGRGGWTVFEAGMMTAFLVTLPWLAIGFWNAVIGALLIARGERDDDPLALSFNPGAAIVTRTAIAMAIRNEAPGPVVLRLSAIMDDLEDHGAADAFDIHILSDTDDAEIAVAEAAEIERWRAGSGRAAQIFYRRRDTNEGYKAGNLREFCQRCLPDYAFFLPLDADSHLSAGSILRLVRTMEQNPRLGILQTLVVGTPARAFFTRVFQFGMRHGMRAYTTGSAWWAGDCGPYWGHNALIRLAPFARACNLPVLPGDGPLGGHVMSHDQVEAVLMRRAGYHVRVIAQEGESWEENPPSLPDFIRRELRWCQGNMQYFQLIGMRGLKTMSRVQLGLAILMYLGAPAWMAFLVLGAASVLSGGSEAAAIANGPGVVLFAIILTMSFAPKLMGLAGILGSRRESARYGGRGRVVLGGLVEIILTTLMAPVVAFAIAVFAVGLLFGQRLDWRAQSRSGRRVSWAEAGRSFWPQTLFGAVLLVVLANFMPGVLPWAVPVIAGLLLAIPLAVVTTSATLSRWSRARGLCDIPEDHAPPPALVRIAPAISA
ncbi:glucans biosynthesis glucosyltransferase MdoH [Acuticoccus sp. MNP-M23]|uniref:glucans biosynthesis glucosyltransferase MdoH n=1 Tax=Acuticoccus sp. MNP-M23 TaxID=3072793 RepID=UPI002816619C|nr:glucans biosynthesis glucosyltransferase MdoH [Acuticoccus sp. MNP-M23]WMS44103.1 glucans biosynthesis glucosyltransferase MdoH [Acuticoccus sp. MNP-M23]